MARNPLQQLSEYGQSVWYDNLSRELITSGGLQRLIDEAGVVGVTSNPTIFDKAITGSDDYDAQIRQLAEAGRTTEEIYEELVVRDIQMAADILRPIFEQSGNNSGDGFVSLEVSPTLAHETQKTMEDARRLFARVDRPNVMIKIPGTEQGLPAIEQMLYEGVNINITLLFSIDAYRAVAERYLRALERRVDEGKPVNKIASVASFFVSRVDTEADMRLDKIIEDEPGTERAEKAKRLKGKLAIANAKLAYVAFNEIFESERFKRLADLGARLQRPLWASTSTKNPEYPDTLYVDELIGPNTVQTLAPVSIEAFKDHGTVGYTLEKEIDAARQVFQEFAELGISYEDITDTLVREGVAAFAKSFESLLNGLDAKCKKFRDDIARERAEMLADLAPAVQDALAELERDDTPNRLEACDPTLWGGDEARRQSVANRLGWLRVVTAMQAEANSGFFEDFANEVRQRDYEYALLLGMGGSSLAPEVLARMYGVREGYPELRIVDTTNPDTIARLADEVRDRKTLFIVSTKSGTTVETMSLYRYFLNERDGDASDFIAITDPGTRLATEAREKGFWRIFENPADIGGRYSALSYFGLIPAAAAGIDIEDLLDRAAQMVPVHDMFHPGIWLGAVLVGAQRAGRDKLTLITIADWKPFGDWLEQLIAESTGKEGTGILPVSGERVRSRESYGDDRLFVVIEERGKALADEATVAALRGAGHPIVRIQVDGPVDLGAEFVRWEVATAVAGKLLGINPFDEPNVQEAKDATNTVLQRGDIDIPGATAPEQAIEDLLSLTKEGGYLAILAYVDRMPEIERALDGLREALGQRTGIAVTLGYGPRYLHSTGQLHKGGPADGAFLEIVATPNRDLDIPGANFSFGQLFAAQSAGDAVTLRRHNLPLVHVTTKNPTRTIDELTSAVNARAHAAD